MIGVTLHCVCFSAACLSISEDAHIVAIEGALNKHLGVFKDLLLRRKAAEARVEVMFSFHVPNLVVGLHFEVKSELVHHPHGHGGTDFFLIVAQRSDSAEHSNFPLHVLNHVVQNLPLSDFIAHLGL